MGGAAHPRAGHGRRLVFYRLLIIKVYASMQCRFETRRKVARGNRQRRSAARRSGMRCEGMRCRFRNDIKDHN